MVTTRYQLKLYIFLRISNESHTQKKSQSVQLMRYKTQENTQVNFKPMMNPHIDTYWN